MFSSIRAKLTLWYTVVVALVIITLAALIYLSFVRALRADIDKSLSEMSNDFVAAARSEEADESGRSRPLNDIAEAIAAFRFRDYQFVVVSGVGKIVGKTADLSLPASGEGSETFSDLDNAGVQYRVFKRQFSISGQDFYLFTYHPLAERVALENQLRNAALIAIPVTLLLAGLGGYVLARRSFRPIRIMSDRASRITSQNLHERLPVINKDDELGSLATVFNELLDRLDKSFEQQRRFMADASHELRTPLAIVQGESEVALSKNGRPAAEYQESLSIVHDESLRLSRIVEDLFTLARADAGSFKFSSAETYIDEIAAECVHSIRTLAEKRNISIDFSSEETLVRGDESLLRRMVLNLLDNAVKYNVSGGHISVQVKGGRLDVTNTGPEIPGSQRTEIFERFFRGDPSRTRSESPATSGAGLGLSIAKWIAELHGAKIELTRSTGRENTFSVTFPR